MSLLERCPDYRGVLNGRFRGTSITGLEKRASQFQNEGIIIINHFNNLSFYVYDFIWLYFVISCYFILYCHFNVFIQIWM